MVHLLKCSTKYSLVHCLSVENYKRPDFASVLVDGELVSPTDVLVVELEVVADPLILFTDVAVPSVDVEDDLVDDVLFLLDLDGLVGRRVGEPDWGVSVDVLDVDHNGGAVRVAPLAARPSLVTHLL